MSTPIKMHHTLALLAGIALGAIGLGQGVSADLHQPAARILVAECQGFEALVSAGSRHLTCATPDAEGVDGDPALSSLRPKG